MGVAPEVDGITDHPYSAHSIPELVPFAATPGKLKRDGIFTADAKGTFASQVRMYREQSAKYRGPKELWLTEQGWPTFQSLSPFGLFTPVDQHIQARYILRWASASMPSSSTTCATTAFRREIPSITSACSTPIRCRNFPIPPCAVFARRWPISVRAAIFA
jgi:hypothetical protein